MEKRTLFLLLFFMVMRNLFSSSDIFTVETKRISETPSEIVYELCLENIKDNEVVLTLLPYSPFIVSENERLIIGFDLHTMKQSSSGLFVYPITPSFPLCSLKQGGKKRIVFSVDKKHWNNIKDFSILTLKIGWIFNKDIPTYIKLPINAFGLKEKRFEKFLTLENIERYEIKLSN